MSIPSENLEKLIDTHAHLHMKHFDSDRTDLYKRTRQLKFILNIATSMEDIYDTLSVSKILENTYAAIGVHPHDSGKVPNDYLDTIESLVKREKKVLAIGEIGLDYYRNLSPIDVQKKVFAEQLMLANYLKKPVILHIRDAYEDTYEIVKSIGAEHGGIVHAFSGDEKWAKKFVKLGFKIGIGGPVTYPKNDLLRSVVKILDVGNIVTETDCPYLPPQQYRGKRNEPAYVQYVYEQIVELLNLELDDLYDKIWQNVKEIFKLDLANDLNGVDIND